MGVPENKPWEFVCKILSFCDDDYFNLKVKSLFSVYIAGYTACYCKFTNQIIKKN